MDTNSKYLNNILVYLKLMKMIFSIYLILRIKVLSCSFFGGIKDKIFGVDGGKYFIKELQNKYPNKNFKGIRFE